jgi:hypothetical protein
MNRERGLCPDVFGRFDLAALAQLHLIILVCLLSTLENFAAST